MTNVRLFVTLLFTVQAVFLLADGWTTWVESRRPRREAMRLGVFVFASAALYFLVQLALSTLVPDFPHLLATLTRVVGGRPGAGPADRLHGGHEAGHDEPGAATLGLLVVAAFLVVTLVDYLVHRFLLHRWLFVVHENHHVPTVVSNLMPGIVARPFVAIPNVLINAGSMIVLLVLVRASGWPDLVATFDRLILPLALVFTTILCASHSSFLRRYEVAERVCRALGIVTPREHLVHHAAEIEGNYGNFTMIWDRVFGTYVPPQAVAPVLGLPYDQDFLGSLTGGWLKIPRAMRDYFDVGAVCRIQPAKGLRPLISPRSPRLVSPASLWRASRAQSVMRLSWQRVQSSRFEPHNGLIKDAALDTPSAPLISRLFLLPRFARRARDAEQQRAHDSRSGPHNGLDSDRSDGHNVPQP